MDYNRNLIANIYYKASNSLTIIAFTYFIKNSDSFLNNYFLSLAISAYASTLILINFFEDKDIGSKEHENLSPLGVQSFIHKVQTCYEQF